MYNNRYHAPSRPKVESLLLQEGLPRIRVLDEG